MRRHGVAIYQFAATAAMLATFVWLGWRGIVVGAVAWAIGVGGSVAYVMGHYEVRRIREAGYCEHGQPMDGSCYRCDRAAR